MRKVVFFFVALTLLFVSLALASSMEVEIHFEDQVENSDFFGRGWRDFTTPTLSTTEHISGSSASIEYRFPVGTTKPLNGSSMRREIPPSDSVYMSYYVKYSNNWVGSQRPYHPHEFYFLTTKNDFYSGLASTHLTAYIEQNDLLPRLCIQDSENIDESQIGVDLVNITENRGVSGCNGDSDGHGEGTCYMSGSSHRNGKHWDAGSQISRGEWHQVEAFFKMNTIQNGKGVADGVIRYWLDGQLILDHSDIMLRTAANSDMLFDTVIIAPWIGDGSPVDQTFWIDQIVVGKEKEVIDPPVTLPSPRNLSVQALE